MQRLPSTQALRALESFERLGAVWKTAEELHITRSAVSHQLRLLERDLGFNLFSRQGTRLVLTNRGRAFATDVRNGLSFIISSASRNADHDLSGLLTISCTPGFASSWLSPKIERFRAICPDVALHIITPDRLDDVSNPEADLFIIFTDETSQDMEFELLREVAFTPLISPVLSNRLGGIQNSADVLLCDFLYLEHMRDWHAWLDLAGLSTDAVRPGITFTDLNLVYNAAIKAQGIALGDEVTCREAINNGQLLRPFDLAVRSPKSYYMAIPPEKAGIANVVAFRKWLTDELSGTGSQ